MKKKLILFAAILLPLLSFANPFTTEVKLPNKHDKTISQTIQSIYQQQNQQINKTPSTKSSTLIFNYCCVAYKAGNGNSQLLDSYEVIVKNTEGNFGHLFLNNKLNSGNKLPAGTYTFSNSPTEFSIDKGYLLWGFLPKSSYININNSIKSVCSGTIVVSYTDDNTINLVCKMQDISNVNVDANCTYTEVESDYYKLEPTEKVTFATTTTNSNYNFYKSGLNGVSPLSKFAIENKAYRFTISMRRPIGTTDALIPNGTYNVAKNTDNALIYSLGERDANELCVLYKDDKPYYITAGTLTISNTGKVMTVNINVTTYNGSSITATTNIDLTNYTHRLEPTTPTPFTEKLLNVTIINNGTYEKTSYNKFALEFESTQTLYYLYLITPTKSISIPNGTYTFNTSNSVGSGIASIGMDGDGNKTGSVVGRNLDMNTGILRDFYYIENGTLKVEDDPRGNGILYTLDITSHFGSTFKSTYSTWVDSELAFTDEPKEKENFTSDFSDAVITQTEDDGTMNMDYYQVNFKEGNNSMNVLFFNTSHNTQNIPEGNYIFNSTPTVNGALASSGKSGNNKYGLSIAIIEKIEDTKTKKNIYFLKSGSIQVVYPDATNKNKVKFIFDVVSHNGSTFKMNCNSIIDPDYAFRKEEKTVKNYNEDSFSLLSFEKVSKPMASIATYDLSFTDITTKNLLRVVLFGDASSTKIPKGTYNVSSSNENLTALASTGLSSDNQITLSAAVMKNTEDEKTPLYYYIQTGTITISYPDASNDNRIKCEVDVKSHFGSSFKFSLDYTINSQDANYEYETRVQSTNDYNFSNLEIKKGAQEEGLYPYNLHFTNNSNETAYIRILTDSKDIPVGDYSVTDKKQNLAIVKSVGQKDKSLEFSLCGTVNDKGSFTHVYFITAGTLNISQEDNNRIYTTNITSYFGSTFTFTYTQIISGIDNGKQMNWGASVCNETLLLNNITKGKSVDIYNVNGQLVYKCKATTSKIEISNLQKNNIYIVRHNNQTVKVKL